MVLSMVFLLVLSLVGALLESASIQMTRSRKRADVDLALESTFAEYHMELLEVYDIFSRFSQEDALVKRLEDYGADGMEHELVGQEVLTDHGGSAYYRQAICYIKNKLHLNDTDFPEEEYVEEELPYEEKKETVSGELETLLKEEEEGLIKKESPLEWAENLKGKGILSLLVAEPEQLSDFTIEPETLPSHRELKKGTFGRGREEIGDKMYFLSYLDEHFSSYGKGQKEGALAYEKEYLLMGRKSDRENLEGVCQTIVNLRMAVNYGYLLTDATRRAEAEAMAVTLCSMVLNPQIEPLVKQALLLTWAYGESIVDVRGLLKGGKVPLVKTAETWQLQLANVCKLGTAKEISGEKKQESGLSYEDYVKGLLLIEETENLCMRSLDLVEANLHVKTDQCVTRVEVQTTLQLRRGIKDVFVTSFRYQ